MSDPHASHTPVNLGAAKEIARRLVERGRFENTSVACREGLRRLDIEQRIVDELIAPGELGVEEELFLVDPHTRDLLVDSDEGIFEMCEKACGPHKVVQELLRSRGLCRTSRGTPSSFSSGTFRPRAGSASRLRARPPPRPECGHRGRRWPQHPRNAASHGPAPG